MKRKVTHQRYVVNRPAYENAVFVRDVLRYLEAQGFDGAPRALGLDDVRETLSFVPGDVHDEASRRTPRSPARPPARPSDDAREGRPLAGEAEIVRHGDPGPHNVVFSGDDAVAFIDWEFAEPGTRLSELRTSRGASWTTAGSSSSRRRRPAAPGVFCKA